MAFDDIIGDVHKKLDTPLIFDDICFRVGRFSISRTFIIKDIDIVIKTLREVIVIEALADINTDKINYLGYSMHFDEIPNIQYGDEVPEYEIFITEYGKGNVTFKRIL